MNYLFILFISSFIFTQNFIYDDEDWMIVSNPGIITSMTIRFDEIFFTSNKGVYNYSKSNQSVSFMPEFIRGFFDKDNRIIHYDSFRDHLWFVNNEKIFFKPYISSIWREIELYQLNIISSSDIINIGSNSDYIFIKIKNEFLVLNPYTGELLSFDQHQIDYYNVNEINISWSSSYYDNSTIQIDLQRFNSFEGYNVVSNEYLEYNGVLIGITNILKGNNKNIWLGTNTGELFRCNLYTNSLEKVVNIPYVSNINYAFYDEYNEWWLTTSDLIRINDSSFLDNRDIFLINWKEDSNEWSYLKNSIGFRIKSSDITSIFRYLNNLYIGTNKGLLRYKINTERWDVLTDINLNFSINSIKQVDDNIYVATNKGIKIFSANNDFLVINNSFDIFNQYAITGFEVIGNRLYILSDAGLFEYNTDNDLITKIDNTNYSHIISDSNNNLYVAKKNELFKINNNGKSYITNIKNIKNMCFCNNYIWFNNYKYVTIFDLISNETFEYDELDGLPSKKIHNIQCDNDWVWFSTNKGLVIYNWSKYHNNEK